MAIAAQWKDHQAFRHVTSLTGRKTRQMDQVWDHIIIQVPPLLVAFGSVAHVADRRVRLFAVDMHQIVLCVTVLAENSYSCML
uniref:Uncharacterized protein n=1 Tax=Candidatus Methanogaster sp. ANME-2c ERB4 TaxID=2759911 RepID=A0A7G9YQF1_9EURY|nr:hypothetical protein LCEAEILH_00001 [Methanosarcinales archaeon ANME-2c ERB4]